jgi:Nucleotidyltransferase domain
MTIFDPSDRDTTLAHVLELLEADPRIEAAVVTGSLGTGRADRWSDIDVATVIADAEDCEAVAGDWIERMYQELPVAHHYRTAFGTTVVPGFLLDNGLEVDLAFTPSAEFSVWAPVRVAFDRTGVATRAAETPQPWSPTPDWSGEAGFAWHDVLHACVAANRGRPWQSLYYLQRVRNRTLALASERHGLDADEFTHVDDLPASDRDPLIGSLIGDLGRTSLLHAVDVATCAFLDELRRGEPGLADRLAGPLLAFVQASQDAG